MGKTKFSVRILDEDGKELNVATTIKSELKKIKNNSFFSSLIAKESSEGDFKSLNVNDIITILGRHYKVNKVEVAIYDIDDDAKHLETSILCSKYTLNKI